MSLSPSLGIPEHYIRTFEKNWNLEVQQLVSHLRDKVMVKNFDGKEYLMTDLDQVEFTERTGRLTQSNPQEVTGKKRKLTKRDFKCQVIFDRIDKELLDGLSTPDSEVIASMRAAWNRTVDQKIVAAASDTVYGGAEPYTSEITLPSSQRVAVDYTTGGGGSNSGLIPEKIIAARKIFKENEIMPANNEMVLAISPEDEEFLETYIKTSGNDVWAARLAEYENGGKLWGFHVVCTNDLTHDTSTDVETAIAWSKAHGIVVGPEKMEVQVDIRPDLDHAVQISAYADYSFTRRYEKGVVEIYADHSP